MASSFVAGEARRRLLLPNDGSGPPGRGETHVHHMGRQTGAPSRRAPAEPASGASWPSRSKGTVVSLGALCCEQSGCGFGVGDEHVDEAGA